LATAARYRWSAVLCCPTRMPRTVDGFGNDRVQGPHGCEVRFRAAEGLCVLRLCPSQRFPWTPNVRHPCGSLRALVRFEEMLLVGPQRDHHSPPRADVAPCPHRHATSDQRVQGGVAGIDVAQVLLSGCVQRHGFVESRRLLECPLDAEGARGGVRDAGHGVRPGNVVVVVEHAIAALSAARTVSRAPRAPR
jgi:hypothetical protein